MPTNQYKPFGTGVGANTLAYAAYNATSALIDAGYTAGEADAQHINTVLRQATVGVAGVAKFATDNGTLDCLDDGSPTNFALALKAAVDALVKLSCPPGKMANFGMSSAPTGWLECNGTAVSRVTYAALFAAIGTTWGVGDGSTTFNLPDARGYALRGWDHGSGVDAGRTFGSTQQDAAQTHFHGTGEFTSTDNDDWEAITRKWVSGGVPYLTHGLYGEANTLNQSTTLGNNITDYIASATTDAFASSRSGAVSETRMKNIAVLVCIKT